MLAQNFRHFPMEIDRSKIYKCRNTSPPDLWNWMKFQDMWYLKYSPDEIVRLDRIAKAHKEFPNKRFTCLEDIADHCLYLSDALTTSRVECDLCDYCAEGNTASFRVEQHRGSKRCVANQKRIQATRNSENYTPDSEKPAFCGLCKKAFANKYTLQRHEETDSGHKEKLRADPLPTTCSVCKHKFNLGNILKCKRHIKSSVKCHRQIYRNNQNCIKWLYLHSRFSCTFDKNKALDDMRIKFVAENAKKTEKIALKNKNRKQEQLAVKEATKVAAKLGVKIRVKVV